MSKNNLNQVTWTAMRLGKQNKDRRKVSPEVERQLALHYIEKGRDASAEMCRSLGLNPTYGVSAATAIGLRRPKWRAGAVSKAKPEPQRSHEGRRNDPRWERAKRIGAVII